MTGIRVQWLVPGGPAPAAVLGTLGATWPQQLYAAGLIGTPTIAAAIAFLLDGWQLVTHDMTAVPGQMLSVDTSAGPVTITLPASGGFVALRDNAGTWDVDPVTVLGNGISILGDTDLVLDEARYRVDLFEIAGQWRYELRHLYGSFPMSNLSANAPFAPATSTPIAATINDTAVHMIGPFLPQLTRPIWLTLNAIVAATGTAQLLRSTDGGTNILPITENSSPIAQYAFGGDLGVIVNEAVHTETDAAATYYLSITLTAGTVAVRLAQ